jgi:hypothetical protein
MKPDSKTLKHLYPLKIALRAQRLIQGSVFYDVFTDMATGQYARIVPNPERAIRDLLIKIGWSEDTYEISWACFKSYLDEFQNPIFQHTIFSIISHWDWYISNLGRFVYFAEKYIYPDKQINKDLLKLNFKPFSKQVHIIKIETGILLDIDNGIIDLIEEMHLVRNLGMHNEWEIDDIYLKYTKKEDMKLGEKRILDIAEITEWHSAFLQLIKVLSYEVAIRYAQAPEFENLIQTP